MELYEKHIYGIFCEEEFIIKLKELSFLELREFNLHINVEYLYAGSTLPNDILRSINILPRHTPLVCGRWECQGTMLRSNWKATPRS